MKYSLNKTDNIDIRLENNDLLMLYFSATQFKIFNWISHFFLKGLRMSVGIGLDINVAVIDNIQQITNNDGKNNI